VNSLLFVKENGSSDNARGKVEMTSRVALECSEQKRHTQPRFWETCNAVDSSAELLAAKIIWRQDICCEAYVYCC
jgi:hypothetical protein